MKFKSLIVITALALVLTVSGCGTSKDNKLTCTKEENGTNAIYTFSFDESDSLTDISILMEFENEQYAQVMYALILAQEDPEAKIDGKNVTYKETVESFKESYELTEVTRAKVKEAVAKENIMCK